MKNKFKIRKITKFFIWKFEGVRAVYGDEDIWFCIEDISKIFNIDEDLEKAAFKAVSDSCILVLKGNEINNDEYFKNEPKYHKFLNLEGIYTFLEFINVDKEKTAIIIQYIGETVYLFLKEIIENEKYLNNFLIAENKRLKSKIEEKIIEKEN